MENIYLVSPIGPEDTMVHVPVGMTNDGMLQNVREYVYKK
jgi:hypothetical protein